MGSGVDDAKGRVKEAAGTLTGDKDLENEGKLDQAGAKAKSAVEKVKDAAESAIDSVRDRIDNDKK
jgi:uncharacterized protein YjbJ (UPF0337 family)